MRRAFTLIEMLVVVVVLAALMGIVVKLTTENEDQSKTLTTITRLHRLENCLSGYYAAYGSYPPVALHGSRDIYLEVGVDGVQLPEGGRNENIWDGGEGAWKQIEAACRSQPVGCSFPFPDTSLQETIDALSERYKEMVESADEDAVVLDREKYSAGFNGLGPGSSSAGELNRKKDKTDWKEIKLFKFGLMSYLLPRYITMANANPEFYSYAQWLDNNENPCDPFTGTRMNWSEVNELSKALVKHPESPNKLVNISSQRVCSRWLPNLEKMCLCYYPVHAVFGVDIVDRGRLFMDTYLTYRMEWDVTKEEYQKTAIVNPPLVVYTPNGGTRDQYLLDSISVEDGWRVEFFYYSPAPHQRYQLWSAGPNGKTFPPWIARENLPEKANKIVHSWTNDDIIQMSH